MEQSPSLWSIEVGRTETLLDPPSNSVLERTVSPPPDVVTMDCSCQPDIRESNREAKTQEQE